MLRLGLVFLCLHVVFAQNDELQAFMEEVKEDYKMLGMAAGAFRGNEWIMKGQIGVRHADDPTLIGENDKFPLSDAARSITSMMAARVVEHSEGRFTWQTTLGEVFGDSMNVPSPFTESTILDLLLHSGHIPGPEQIMRREELMEWYDDLWAASEWESPEENIQQRLNMTRFLVNIECQRPNEDPLCSEGRYSKFTYSVAVSMIEKSTSKSFDVLLAEEVFGPLSAPDCGVGPTTLDQSLPPAQPWSHFSGPWGVYNIPVLPGDQSNMPSSMAPDVGIHCSLNSWKNVLAAHLTRNESFLTEKSWSVLQDAGVRLYDDFDYAPGFVVESSPFITSLQHPGGDLKEYSQVFLIPDHNVGLVIAANQNLQEGMRQMVGMHKIRKYLGQQLSKITGISIEFEKTNYLQSLFK